MAQQMWDQANSVPRVRQKYFMVSSREWKIIIKGTKENRMKSSFSVLLWVESLISWGI